MNGHRACFKTTDFTKSALSNHIYNDHLEKFENKLKSFKFGIIKKVSPFRLDITEDFYIYTTNADTIGLNRYKVSRE